jgi:hypothetical protein
MPASSCGVIPLPSTCDDRDEAIITSASSSAGAVANPTGSVNTVVAGAAFATSGSGEHAMLHAVLALDIWVGDEQP